MERTVSTDLETALEHTAPTRTQWDAWTRPEPALAGLTYQDLRSELQTGTDRRKDELLAALVRTASTDSLAFNVVAACLLPGTRHRIARYAPMLERQDAVAVMVAALHEAVGRYNVDEPPQFLAQTLLVLPSRRLRHAVAAHQAWSSYAVRGAEDAAHACGPELSAAALLGTAVDAGVLADHDARLIHDTRVTGRPLREVARQIGLAHEAAKKRHQRAEAAWVAWWEPERRQRRSQR
ncbi:MAG: hypothetical protein ACRD0V_22540 [Acidimicrobiales bacterium]